MSVPTFKLNKDQQEKTKRIFAALDTDKSGYIEVNELGPVVTMLETMGITIDKRNLEIVVGKFDTSKKKRLNQEQFSQMLIYLLDLKNKAEAQAAKSPNVQKITVTTGGSRPTTITTSGTSQKTVHTSSAPLVRSASGTPPHSPAASMSRSSSTPTPATPTPRVATSTTPTPRAVAAPAPAPRAPTSTPSRTKTRKAPLRRLKDAFVKHLGSISKDKEHSPAVTTVVVREKQEAPPRSVSSSSAPSKAVPASSLFVDNSFPANSSILPRHSASGVVAWKRPHEMCDNPRLFVDGTEEGDVVQGALGNCWFVGALAVLASSGNEFIEHTFVKADMRHGEYKCKFYKDGGWVTVTVDDRLPCGASGRPYFASCPDPNEWWVPIIEKAYAKLHGSYEALESGTITDALKDMSGEAVDMIKVDDAEYKDKTKLWKKLLHNTKESFLMGCAIEDVSAGMEKDNGYGLLANHAYSIIDCQEVQGYKLLRIRNPWGKGEWKGPWSDGSKEWTPSLLKHFDFEFGNDGTFFMKFDDFVRFFNRIHVLCLLTDDQGEVWKKAVIPGKWKGETAGGCSNNPTWPNNPQYMLVSSSPNNQILIGLSQADLRYKHKKSPGKSGLKYEAIGVIVLRTTEQLNGIKVTQNSAIEREGSPVFMMQRDTSFDFVAQKDKSYVLVPSTFNRGVEGPFELLIYSQRPIKLYELQGGKK